MIRTRLLFRTPCARYFSSRRAFEEEHHLARALSRNQVDPKQQKAWSKKMKNRDAFSSWGYFQECIPPPLPYELDALKQIHKMSYEANVLLEIRDVRLPASSHHPSFTRLAKHRLHLICYTHADVIDSSTRDRVEDWTLQSWPESRSIFVDSRENRSDLKFDLLYDSLLQHLDERGGINAALTVGVPNTGKSSLLLALLRTARNRGLVPKKSFRAASATSRKRSLKKTGAPGIHDVPGKTRIITQYLLREKPRAFFLDVPGLTPPPEFFRERPQALAGFAAANLLPQSRRRNAELPIATCAFLLDCLNRDFNFQYVVKLGLEEPTNDVMELLEHVKRGRDRADPETLQLQRCQTFLKLFNTGNLGPVILDDLREPYRPFVFRDPK